MNPTTSDRDDQDAAAVLAVLFAIAGSSVTQPKARPAPSVWADPGHRIGRAERASASGWWASGMPR